MTNLFEQEKDDFRYIAQELIDSGDLIKLLNKTVLLVGGSGFLGTAFKKLLLYCNDVFDLNCKIISVDNYIKGTVVASNDIEAPNLINITHNIILPINKKISKYKIDYILNCSGNAAPKNYLTYPWETIDVSVIGTRNLLDLAEILKIPILNFSSSEVLGTPQDKDIPTSEDCLPCFNSTNDRAPYDTSKLMIETMSFLAKKEGVDCKVVRPFNVTGYFHKEDYRVLPNFFGKVLKGEPLQIYKPGTQTRTFCFYSDFLIGAFKVLLNDCDLIYHIGNSDNEISMIDLANKVATLCKHPELVELVDTPEVYKHEPKRRCPSIEKARHELSYNPKVNLDKMLSKIYHWCRETY